MKKIKDLFFIFACVTTCVVLATAIYTSIFWPQRELGTKILWEILSVSFLCSLGVCIYPEKEVSSRRMLLMVILHYIEVNIVVLGFGIWFEWFYVDNLAMVLGMLLLIAVIFLLVSVICWKRTAHMAELMNEQLKEYQKQMREDGSLKSS